MFASVLFYVDNCSSLQNRKLCQRHGFVLATIVWDVLIADWSIAVEEFMGLGLVEP